MNSIKLKALLKIKKSKEPKILGSEKKKSPLKLWAFLCQLYNLIGIIKE